MKPTGKQQIVYLKDEMEQEVRDRDEIATIMDQFYGKLYNTCKKEHQQAQKIQKGINVGSKDLPKITEEEVIV